MKGLIYSGLLQPKETYFLNSPCTYWRKETSLEDDSEQDPNFQCSESFRESTDFEQ